MPVYPGTPSPRINQIGNYIIDGYRELSLNLLTHTGTHIDTPAHIIENGKSLSGLPVSKFIGRALKLEHTHEHPLTIEAIRKFKPVLEETDFVIFQTNWSLYWGADKYYNNFPVPDSDIIQFLTEFNLKGIGIDTISVDPVGKDLPNHLTILSKDMIIIENLTNLSQIKIPTYELMCFPLSIKNGDGSPVRAIARL
jgi:kynurenine formamidase